MDIIHLSEWLKIVLAGWVVISLLAAPLVGRFLAGALHEREVHEPEQSPAPRIRRGRRRSAAQIPAAEPSNAP